VLKTDPGWKGHNGFKISSLSLETVMKQQLEKQQGSVPRIERNLKT
jgi:hypothetical protein